MDRQKIARGVGLSEELFKHRIMRRRGGALCHRLIPACLSCRDSTSHECLWHPGNRDFTFRYENIFPRTASVTSFFDAVRKSRRATASAQHAKTAYPRSKGQSSEPYPRYSQTFWRDDRLPWLELRSTWRSRQPISATATPALGGAIIEGKRAACALAEYLLQPGDLIVIPPHAPHSCNPLHGRPRSYHMLLPGRDMVPRAAPGYSPAPVSPRRSRCCATAPLCQFPAGCRPDEPREP